MIDGLLSPMHLLLILGIALIVLGPKRLPEAGRGLGSAIRGFKETVTGSGHDEPAAVETTAAAPQDPQHTV